MVVKRLINLNVTGCIPEGVTFEFCFPWGGGEVVLGVEEKKMGVTPIFFPEKETLLSQKCENSKLGPWSSGSLGGWGILQELYANRCLIGISKML